MAQTPASPQAETPRLKSPRLKSPRLLFVAGEASGDLHAGRLIAELKKLLPDLDAFGVGGGEMESAGCRLLHSLGEMQVMGFAEVLSAIPRLSRIGGELVELCRTQPPDAAVLVDYPDFNMRLAGKLSRLGVRVVYYISPQVWAWRPSRVRKMRGVVELMMVLFGFEAPLYEAEGVPVRWVGHPLVDSAASWPSRAEARAMLGLREGETALALLPGSRPQTLHSHMGIFAEAARLIASRLRLSGSSVRILAAESPSLPEGAVSRALGESVSGVSVVRGQAPLVITASGTATLEAALAGTPMVVCYRTSALSYLIARALVRVSHISLVNIVAGRRVVPELIQSQATPERIAAEAIGLLGDAGARTAMLEGLAEVRSRLGPPGASARAAAAVVEVLSGQGGAQPQA
jgi:lipid-A-disaccharide synthase